ncbi:multiple epidermal growth factor-like domains protein 9 isoform X2 [Myxocyprinus asiaticus]|uniref:multiple epidermal growth factor-like domains protein 9 isoform X2 n=1 Tax=Myxocyprinus asiaticus TaxID=70543 RepID=UPI00222274F0|nr:multiple epidermal growth factor-like domains protein 9 isoform X2 [Myxocyprinus asiaticus]
MRYSMLLVSILELLLFGCTAGLFRSAHRASDDDNSGARLPRAVLEEPLQATTIPNHLQEDDGNYRFSPFTPKMTITTKDSRTTGKTSQLQPLWVTTTTAAPVTKTIDPTFKRSRVKENSTFTTGLNITVKPTSSYPVNQTQNTPPPTLDTANSSWTVRSTSKPLFLTTEKGPQCNCSAEGSVDPDACDRFTGQCVCMTGYTGHWCDECEDKYFTNGTNGCQACDCDSYGAMSQLCNSSGVCMCKMGVHGDKCDDCRPGFSHFSSTGCQPCQCNNHSSYCHPQSGICENCQGNTIGPSCENCRYNFYRRPGSPATDACIPCPCSSVTSTGSCRLVVHTTPSTTTHWFHYSTMTSSPNATAQFTSTSLATTLITSLASSTPNTTTATVTPLPWNHFNIIVLAVIIIVVVALMAVVGGVYTYREYQNRKLNAPFWTIELKEDNISFSSYHDSIPNADISGLLEDEVSEMGNGQLALTGPGILYKV